MGRRNGRGIAGGSLQRRRQGEALLLGDTLIVIHQLSETRVSLRIFSPSQNLLRRLTPKEAVEAMQQRAEASQ